MRSKKKLLKIERNLGRGRNETNYKKEFRSFAYSELIFSYRLLLVLPTRLQVAPGLTFPSFYISFYTRPSFSLFYFSWIFLSIYSTLSTPYLSTLLSSPPLLSSHHLLFLIQLLRPALSFSLRYHPSRPPLRDTSTRIVTEPLLSLRYPVSFRSHLS